MEFKQVGQLAGLADVTDEPPLEQTRRRAAPWFGVDDLSRSCWAR